MVRINSNYKYYKIQLKNISTYFNIWNHQYNLGWLRIISCGPLTFFYLLFLLLDSSELRRDDTNGLFAPKNDAHVKGADPNQNDRKDVGDQEDQDVVTVTRTTKNHQPFVIFKAVLLSHCSNQTFLTLSTVCWPRNRFQTFWFMVTQIKNQSITK